MNVLQHTRNERNPRYKQNRPDRSYRDTLLSVKGSHVSKVCRFSCFRYNFALSSMSLSGRPFLYDNLLRSGAGGVLYREVEIFFKSLQRILMLDEVFHAPRPH